MNLLSVFLLLLRSIVSVGYYFVQACKWIVKPIATYAGVSNQNTQREENVSTAYELSFFNQRLFASFFQYHFMVTENKAHRRFEFTQLKSALEKIKAHVSQAFTYSNLASYTQPYTTGKGVLSDLRAILQGLKEVIVSAGVIFVTLFCFPLRALLACFSEYTWESTRVELLHLVDETAFNLLAASYTLLWGLARLRYLVLIPIRCIGFLENKFHEWNHGQREEIEPLQVAESYDLYAIDVMSNRDQARVVTPVLPRSDSFVNGILNDDPISHPSLGKRSGNMI